MSWLTLVISSVRIRSERICFWAATSTTSDRPLSSAAKSL